MKENFIITENKDGTYQVADKDGTVFDWGKSVNYACIDDGLPNCVKVYETDGKCTLYNKNGMTLEGAYRADDISIYLNGSYNVVRDGVETFYDNGAKKRKYLKRTFGIMAALCALSVAGAGLTKCSSLVRACLTEYAANVMQKKELENQTPATYLGTWQMHGYQYMMFDTDGNDKTVEYYGYPRYMQEVGKALQIQKGEKRPIGAWRDMGLKIESAQYVMVKD